MADVRVTSRVKHNGSIFEAGEVVSGLSDKQAQQLVDSGEASFDTEGEQPSTGRRQRRKPSQIKSTLSESAATTDKPSVSDKAADRQTTSDAPADDTTGDTSSGVDNAAGGSSDSESQNTGNGATVTNTAVGDDTFSRAEYPSGAVRYLKNGERVSKANYDEAVSSANAPE